MKRILISGVLYMILILFRSCTYAYAESDVSEMTLRACEYMYQDPIIAIEYAEKAHERLMERNDTLSLFNAKLLLSSIYALNGNYDVALEIYLNAENYIDYTNALNVADYNIHMASMYLNLQNTYKSRRYNNTAYSIYLGRKDTVGMGWCLNLRGLIYTEEKKYSEAQSAFNESLHIWKQLKDVEAMEIVINNISILPGNETDKIRDLSKVIVSNQEKGNKWALAENYNNMGMLYYRLGNNTMARRYLDQAKIIADTLNISILKRDNLQFLTKIAVSERNYKEAYSNFETINEINKVINSMDKIRRIEDEAQQKKQLLHLHKLEKKENELMIAKQKNFILFISGSFIIILLMLSIRMYHYRKVNKLTLLAKTEEEKNVAAKKELELKQDELEHRDEMLNISNKELTDMVYFIRCKDKLLDNVLNMLQDAQKKTVDDPRMRMKSIVTLIRNFREKEIKADLFIQEIKKSEEAFLHRLSELHPDLSKNEKILVTMLRIGLSSKEIALLLDSNPKTINMARYRLRKKLDLETDDNLVDYFEAL
ncbi:MAG: transcriptional regulator [Marinifilaceae bacterium]